MQQRQQPWPASSPSRWTSMNLQVLWSGVAVLLFGLCTTRSPLSVTAAAEQLLPGRRIVRLPTHQMHLHSSLRMATVTTRRKRFHGWPCQAAPRRPMLQREVVQMHNLELCLHECEQAQWRKSNFWTISWRRYQRLRRGLPSDGLQGGRQKARSRCRN